MSTSYASQHAWTRVHHTPPSAPVMSREGYAMPADQSYGAPQQSMGWGPPAPGAGPMPQNAFSSNYYTNGSDYIQGREGQDPRAYAHVPRKTIPTANPPHPPQPRPGALTYDMQYAPAPANDGPYPTVISPHIVSSAHLTTSPDPMGFNQVEASPPIQQQQQQGFHPFTGPVKRMRPGDTEYNDHDDADDEDRDINRNRPQGACARCKGLKVKCEFRLDTDVCKRCLNAGQPCQIPGRKKRRTPPKREHLLNQIREQADQIQKLMAQLEQVGHGPESIAGSSPARTSPNGPSAPLPAESDAELPTEKVNPIVEEWIAKARERFDDFLSVAGSAPISYVQDDPEESDEDYADSEYDFVYVDAEGHASTSEATVRPKDSPPMKKRTDPEKAEKLTTLPSEAAPYGLMANLSLMAHPRRAGSAGDAQSPKDNVDLSIANYDFFRSSEFRKYSETSPRPDPERSPVAVTLQLPAILTRGVITPEVAESLFKIYFETMNQSVSLLDPVLYTAVQTCHRSPFLFTVICALASRFHPKHTEIYPQLMRYALQVAGTALISGPKTVDMCHAFILLALYPMPAKHYADDRSWLFLGTAIRIAMDLNLQYPNTARPLNENHAREMLNRTRVWINCYNLDRSMGSTYGKAPVINQTDYTATHTQDWWHSSPWNLVNFDIHLCAYNAELRALSGFIRKVYSNPEHPTGLNKEVDLERLSMDTDDEIQKLQAEWMGIIEHTDMADPQNRFRTGLLRLAWSYARLAVLSYGFQHEFGKNNSDENPFLERCLTAAKDVVTAMVDGLGQPSERLYMRNGPEAQKVFATFAATFLIKLLQPRFASYLPYERRLEIRNLVKRVIDFLSSPDIAVDDQHGPKLHARFLKGLLASPLAQVREPASRATKCADVPAAASSPESAGALTPAPSTAATSFDTFTATNPFPLMPPPVSATSGIGDFNMMSDMFNPPLPQYDQEIMQRMMELPSQWQEVSGVSLLPEEMMPEVRVGSANWWSSQFQSGAAEDALNVFAQGWPMQ